MYKFQLRQKYLKVENTESWRDRILYNQKIADKQRVILTTHCRQGNNPRKPQF